MSRIVRSGLAVFALLLALLVGPALAGAAPAPGPGNSPNAKACQKGGYTTLVRSDGTTFASEEACTSYAAKGGALFQRAAAPCLNGGYANYQTTDGVLFASQTECVAYVGNGGTLAPKTTLVASSAIFNGGSHLTVTGTGLQPGSLVYYTANLVDGRTVTFSIGPVNSDGTFFDQDVLATCGRTKSATVSATTASGETITTNADPVC